MRLLAFLLLVAALHGCATAPPPSPTMDLHSFARAQEARATHVALDLVLDFAAHEARGTATLRLARPRPGAPLVLDTKGLAVERVQGSDGGERAFRLGPPDPVLGTPLTIVLEPGDTEVRVAYRTTGAADAMQWLEPAQTAGGTRPFLFTQGQAILTRTWIPLQDTPGNRVTWEARVRAPEGLRVVMSGEQLGQDAGGTWCFRQDRAVPPYLIALACGELRFAPISARCGVYAEPSVVHGAAAELEDTERMLAAAEALFGPYRWGRYDLLILPPAFPFGGMENPCLTFATPTILAGDRSLVNLVAHELAHSWSGNLVSNATWRDFWLNEGFTVYCEGRIMEEVYGTERARMEQRVALGELEREMRALPPGDQILHLDLTGRNPDDGMTQVAYEKGAWLLRTLEHAVGRARFDRFLREWFDGHAFQSVTTAELAAFLRERLLDAAQWNELHLDEWLHAPGIPANAVAPASALLAVVDRAVQQDGLPEARGWVTQQWLHYLRGLPDPLTPERMAELDARFRLTRSDNSEILCAWLGRAIRSGYAAADARLEEFLLGVGRRKLVKPLYEELVKTEAGKARARAIYARARPRYHAVTTRTLDGIVGAP